MNELLDSADSKKWKELLSEVTEAEYEYTGAGVFVSFSVPPLRSIEGSGDVIFDGVLIESPELELGATATAFVRKGILSSLEIWSYSGVYPRQDLKNYQLKKTWKQND